VRRSLAVAIVAVALIAGACSTPVYTSDTAVHDLETRSGLTHTQAECIVNAIRKHFETEIVAKQKANHLTKLPADRLKLEIDGALAALRSPTGAEQLAARRAISTCAPGDLQ
jgi:hypothetical protein